MKKRIVLEKEGEEIIVSEFLEKEKNIELEVVHMAQKTKSTIKLRGIAEKNEKIVMKVLVRVEKGAKGAETNTDMKILLLSEGSAGLVEPKMEILENEVKAVHSASVGKIDEQELFYLMSRGLSKSQAERMIVEGFK
jgi:Fe-S cluster assembly protein SufD